MSHVRAFALAVLVAVAAGPAAAQAAGPVDPGLSRLARDRAARPVEVIVQFRGDVSLAAARKLVRHAGGRPLQTLPLIRGLAADMTPRAALRLRWWHRVRAVTLNRQVRSQALRDSPDPKQLATVFPFAVGADHLWDRATGEGVGVAVIDTGVAGDLPDFRTSSDDATSRVVASVVTNPNATTAADTYGHGTHVAGILAGNGAARPLGDGLFGRYVGVAPEADIVAIKASDDQGNASVLDVINGLQFAIEHRDDLNIRVVNLSLQADSPGSYRTDPLDAAVEAAWANGIVVVAAAGNRGDAADAVQYAPANDPFVITVGALDDKGTRGNGDDEIASFSSRGVTQDGISKPDVYAPGAHIVSTLAPNSAFSSFCPSCIVDGGYIRAGGTSMAAPVVSGAIADLLQLHPDWTPDMVKGALLSSLKRSKDGVPMLDDINRAVKAGKDKLHANDGVQPNDAAGSADGGTDPTRSSWSRSSWSQASGGKAAAWARSSWSCTCSGSRNGDGADPTRSSWSRSSWSSVLGR